MIDQVVDLQKHVLSAEEQAKMVVESVADYLKLVGCAQYAEIVDSCCINGKVPHGG